MSSREIMNAQGFGNKLKEYPDAKKHQLVSFIKSGVRLLGYIFLPFNLYIAMGILLISEIIGIIEELV